jgi:6-phosphofructokinase 1
MDAKDFDVKRLKPATLPTPHKFANRRGGRQVRYVEESERVLVEVLAGRGYGLSFERAGPRSLIAYDPARTTAAILTAGGLCPGLNDVIRALVLALEHHYGVQRILGIPYGYAGLMRPFSKDIRPITSDTVRGLSLRPGTILGSGRTVPDVPMMVDTLRAYNIDILFCIGGDGTQTGAHEICEEVAERGLDISVIGVPKTIDNDVQWVEKTFGFDTAVDQAARAVQAAHVEAECAINGVGLVKLMGRDSGFIAAHAALAGSEANYVLVPEVPFEMEGPHGLLAALEKRLEKRRHAVVVVAEGAGKELLAAHNTKNAHHQKDIGVFLRDQVKGWFKAQNVPLSLKYIDPSYIIRAAATSSADATFCLQLGHHAVHAAMAGRTDMLVGSWHNVFTHVPIPICVTARKKIDPDGDLWRAVLESTGQPPLTNDPAARS